MESRSQVAAGVPGRMKPSGPFEVVLCEAESSPEVVATVATYDDAEFWVREWLMEPLGFAVGIRAIPNDTIGT